MTAKLLLGRGSVAFWTAGLLAAVATGCPDPDATYQRFLDDTADTRTGAGGTIIGEGLEDIGAGTFFLTIRPTVFAANPLIFRATTTALEPTADGGATVDVAIDPLVADVPQASNCPAPRSLAPVHPADTDGSATIHVNDVVITPNGELVIDFGQQLVHGCANAISGANIKAVLKLTGITRSENRFCGNMEGALIEPYNLGLDGQFAFVRLEGDAIPGAGELPPNSECPEEGTGGTGGTGAGGSGGTGAGGTGGTGAGGTGGTGD